jgi:hypothetical protein
MPQVEFWYNFQYQALTTGSISQGKQKTGMEQLTIDN